jgi:inner membrane protein
MSEVNWSPSGKTEKKNDLVIRLGSIGILAIILLIPTFFVMALVDEREANHNEVLSKISASWGDKQRIAGPVLTIPHVNSSNYFNISPEKVLVKSDIVPMIKYKGIYKTIVYKNTLKITASFKKEHIEKYENYLTALKLDKSIISLTVSDLEGVNSEVIAKCNGISQIAELAISDLLGNTPRISFQTAIDSSEDIECTFEFELKGSSDFEINPSGKKNNIIMKSSWKHPNFTGDHLPDSYAVSDSGFYSEWQIFGKNGSSTQSWLGNYNVLNKTFAGVNLLIPADQYQQTTRSLKYAVMFIVLTFFAFFIIEILTRKKIHIIQYLLVGSALVLFYVLLLSISEYLGFTIAYCIASAAIILMITLYSISILKSTKFGLIIAITLIALYLFLFTIIRMYAYSLLAGSIGLFVLLGLVMFFTRKLDFFKSNIVNED